MADAPWAGMDPNSDHQLWSRWRLTIRASRYVPLADVKKNLRSWLRLMFGSVLHAKIDEKANMPEPGCPHCKGSGKRRSGGGMVPFRVTACACLGIGYAIVVELEGKPAHDPAYVDYVLHQFALFVEKGWGPLATSDVGKPKILAGDEQDGKPRSQLVVMPGLLDGGGRDT